jgi:hypothetical protein
MSTEKQQIEEGLFGTMRNFSDSFFDGLKSNAINHALNRAKDNPKMPSPVVKKMIQLDKDAKELRDFLKQYGG